MPNRKLLGKFGEILKGKNAEAKLTALLIAFMIAATSITVLLAPTEKVEAAWNVPSDYSYHYKITISNTNSSALTNFQVRIVLNASVVNYSHWLSNGYDTLFTDATNTTIYHHYMEVWNTSGDSIFWVNVTNIPTGTSVMYMHCGQAGITTDPSDFDNTFTKSYAGDATLDVEWLLDEGTGTVVADTSGNNINGTIVGNATWVGSEGGQWDGHAGVTFSTGDSIQIDEGGDAVTDNGQLSHPASGTWEVWYKHLGTPPGLQNAYIVYCDAAGDNDGDAGIMVDRTNNTIYARITDTTPHNLYSGVTATVGTWYHLVLTLDNGTAKFYVNGELKASATTSASSLGNALRNVSLGNYYNTDYVLNGTVDSFRQYHRALSAEEISRHYYMAKYANPLPTYTISLSGGTTSTVDITLSGYDTDKVIWLPTATINDTSGDTVWSNASANYGILICENTGTATINNMSMYVVGPSDFSGETIYVYTNESGSWQLLGSGTDSATITITSSGSPWSFAPGDKIYFIFKVSYPAAVTTTDGTYYSGGTAPPQLECYITADT